MANIKKYNPESQSWETWASNSATGVYSVNPSLVPEDEEAVSVEDALIRDRDDIELMKKNISWLALHGGGGSGGGGGSSDADITNTIEVYDINGNVTTNMVWRSTYSSISYRVFSSKNSNKFNISVALDGRVIETQKGIDSNRQMSVKIGTLKKTTNNKHTLRIVALDLYDNMTAVNVELTELALSVSGTNANNIYTVDISEVLANGTLSVNCKSSIVGKYLLYWGTSSDIDANPLARKGHTSIMIESAFDYQVTIPYWAENREDRLLENNIVSVGKSLMFYFLLVKEDDTSVASEVLELVSTVVSPDNLAIKPLSLSPEINEITKISKAGVLNCNFIVYLNATSFQYWYRVTVNKLVQNVETGEWERGEAYPSIFNTGTGEYKKTTAIMYNNLHRDDFFEGGSRYEFIIYAEDRMNSSKNGQISTYVEIQNASDTEIDLGNEVNRAKIFDFNVRDHVADEETWVWSDTNEDFYQNNQGARKTVFTTANLIHMGGKSRREITHYRFTNKAHMIINQSLVDGVARPWFPSDTSSNDSGIVSASGPQCTLSIRYYNDYTPDDNRTIFNFGNYVPQTATSVATGQGILINNHDFYIKLGTNSNLVTGKIQDSIYHAIDIVIGRNNQSNDGSTTVEVYHNGVLLAFGKENRVTDFYQLSRFNEMSIACNKRGNTKTQHTNIKLQGVTLYSKALDPYQVVCNYINNLVTWNLTENNELNSELLNSKLATNLILKDNEGNYSCPIWNYGEFDTHRWIEDNLGTLRPSTDLLNVCPIPIIILDFYAVTEWEWDVFTESWEDKNLPGVQVPIYYFQPYNTGQALNGELVTVSVQGTTSKSYAIKNLNIDFGEDKMFWAKTSWFPERVYTLKADIVDSAHVNNACIGKFVNTCAQNTNLLEPTPPMRYFNSNKDSAEFSDLPLSALGDGGLTVKHTLEGFPVLLLARFQERGAVTNRSLGIYSFNLGREAYHNMGFELLKRFRNVDQSILGGDEKAPMLLGSPNMAQDVIEFNAESWEGKDSFNCSPKTANTKTKIDEKSNNGYDSSVNAGAPVQLDGYFWSDYPGHINHFWSQKYPEGGTSGSKFQELCTDLVQCPYVKGNFDTGDRGNVYQYDWDGTQMIVPDQTNRTLQLQRLNKSCPFNIKNAVFYYVTCMLFGLVDSLGKNLNMRIWNKEQDNSQWYTCFYDMDTAMGLDNIGTEKVQPDVLDESLSNNPEIRRSFIVADPNQVIDNRKMYTVKDNKLWGIIDHSIFKDQFVGNATEGNTSSYASVWSVIRTNYLKSVDDFMDSYFNNQTDGIGELLYNQDFDIKYLGTPQYTFMYGDRKAFVRDWITKRIKFLDSYFGYLQKTKSSTKPYLESVNIQDCSYKNKIVVTHQSGEEYLPIVSSTPCVLTSTIGNQSNQYSYYLPANTAVPVRFANAIGTPGIQTWINNSDLLLEIRNMSDIRVSKIGTMETYTIPGMSGGDELYSKQLGTLSSFTKFNLSGNVTFDNKAIDFIKLFKTWNNGSATLPYSLTELNLSSTKNSNVTDFALNLTSDISGPNGETYYQNPFENLTDINIRESCITGVRLPRNIALNTLEIAGSAIEDVTLQGQSILKTVDFTGCTALTQIILDDCAAFETLTAENLPNLALVQVRKCPALQEVYINLYGRTEPTTIQIDEVPNLKKITIKNANADTFISIIASGLEELSLPYCNINDFELSSDCRDTLKSLDLSNSKVKWVNWDGRFEGDYLDLIGFNALVAGGINITNNKVIEKVQLPNERDNPVNLNFSFDGCTNLTRIYGNLNINRAGAFQDCKKFKIHGDKFNNINVIDSRGRQMYLGDFELSDNLGKICLKDEFQEGLEVTNLTVNTNGSAANTFRNTAVSAFDVYYILRHLGSNVTSIASMFRDCPNIKFKIVSSTVDNSPHWTMFDKCGKVTSVNALFYGNTSMGPFRIYGNHEGESDEPWAHQGLFTPLVKCSNFEQVFGADSYGQAWFMADLNTFKLPENTYFGGNVEISILNFRPKDIYVNLNKMSTSEVYTAYSNPTSGTISSYQRGTTVGFFDGFYKLPSSLTRILYGLRYMNFGTDENIEESNRMLRLPIEVTSLNTSFTADSTGGYAILQRMFTKNENEEYNVTTISNCFDGSSGATWRLSNSTLTGFTRLSTFSSVFSGLTKIVNGLEFPYNIFDPCASRISNITGFFAGVRSDGYLSVVDIPGRLFERCTNLSNITSCFSNFHINYNLTPNGFINTKLTTVDQLFYEATGCQNGMPNNFFNLGFTDTYVTIIGAGISKIPLEIPENATCSWVNGDYVVSWEPQNPVQGDIRGTRRYRNVEQDEEDPNIVYCTPLSLYTEQTDTYTGYIWQTTSSYSDLQSVKEYNDWEPTEQVVHKRTPRKLISSMKTVFYDSGVNNTGPLSYKYTHPELDIYHSINEGGDVEDNPDYCPFDYLYQNEAWIKVVRDDHPFTFMWSFDGSWTQELKQADLSDFLLDDEAPYNVKSTGNASEYFGCPPDLLRWCTTNPDLTSLFTRSNFVGRIPPYLLKPVPNLTALNSVFSNAGPITACCTMLEPKVFNTIPKTFFDYVPNLRSLRGTFQHLTLYTSPNVFANLKKELDVESIFYAVVWSGGTSSQHLLISNVFSTNRISNCRSAFNGSYSETTRKKYITFSNVFSTDPNKHSTSNDYYVFYGYESGYVTHESSPTCSTMEGRYNYSYYVAT